LSYNNHHVTFHVNMTLLLVFNPRQDFTLSLYVPELIKRTAHANFVQLPCLARETDSELVVASDMYRAVQVFRNTYRKV